MSLRTLLGQIDDFFNRPGSALPYAVFRIVFGLVLLANALLLLPDINMWFSDQGVLPSHVDPQLVGLNRLNVFAWWGSSTAFVNGAFAALILSILCVILGFQTRLACIVVFVLVTSFYHRNVYVLHAGDVLLRITCLFLCFSDCGLRLSVDRLIKLARGLAQPGDDPQTSPLAMRLIQLQLCIVYGVAAGLKSNGAPWIDGTAVYLVYQLESFARFPVPEFMHSLPMARFLTWSTLFLEAAFPIFVWFRETRWIALISLFLFHMGLEYVLNVQMFQYIITSLFILFILPKEFQRAAAIVQNMFQARTGVRRLAVRVVTSESGSRLVAVLRALDILDLVQWNTEVVAHANEMGSPGVARRVLLRLPALTPFVAFASLPGLRSVTDGLLQRLGSTVAFSEYEASSVQFLDGQLALEPS